MDNYRTNGIWRTGSTLPANCPAGFTWSQLTATVVGTTYRQELVNGGATAVRMGNSSSWYAWILRPTRDDIDINTITPFSSLSSGYTLQSGTVYKQGNHVFGDVVIACTALGTGQTGFGTLTYAPLNPINTYCALSTSEWAVHRVGYFFINGGGGVTVRDSTGGATFIKIHLDYVTN